MSKITKIKPLSDNTLETNAYGGCYINNDDFAAREQINPTLWRMYDHSDDAIKVSGPLYQFADNAMVEQMAAFFSKESQND